MVKLSLLGLGGGLVAAVMAIVLNSQSMTVVAMALVLTSIEVVVLANAAGGFTPIVIPVLIVNTVLLCSLLLWDRVQAVATVSVTLHVTEEYQIQAVVIGIVFSGAYTVGALLAGPRRVQMSLETLGSSVTQLASSFRVPNGALVAVGYAVIALMVYALQGALLQGQYLDANGPHWALVLSNSLSPLALLALCLVAARPGPWRALAIAGVGVIFIILFSRATRTIAALPAVMVLATAITSGRKVRVRSVVVAAVATVLLVQLVLVGRANRDGVGILPLGAQLFTRTDELFSGFSLNAIIGNILVTGPQTAVVAHRPIPSQALWISLNPMPGAFAGWPEIQPSLRLNAVTPYTALGELAAHGWVALVVVAGAAGFVLSLSTRMASNLRGAYAMTAMVLVLATVTLFSVDVLQYYLRNTTRLVWYTIFGVAGIWLAQAIFTRERAELEDQDVLERSGVSHNFTY